MQCRRLWRQQATLGNKRKKLRLISLAREAEVDERSTHIDKQKHHWNSKNLDWPDAETTVVSFLPNTGQWITLLVEDHCLAAFTLAACGSMHPSFFFANHAVPQAVQHSHSDP